MGIKIQNEQLIGTIPYSFGQSTNELIRMTIETITLANCRVEMKNTKAKSYTPEKNERFKVKIYNNNGTYKKIRIKATPTKLAQIICEIDKDMLIYNKDGDNILSVSKNTIDRSALSQEYYNMVLDRITKHKKNNTLHESEKQMQ